MTIEKIESEIRTGQCRNIWYSTKSLWWTHSPADVKEASEKGWKIMREKFEAMLNDPSIKDKEKRKTELLLKSAAATGRSPIPCDPTGAALFSTDKPHEWCRHARMKASGFGAHGLVAFMKAHHQNCEEQYHNNWTSYNLMLSK